jgi:hypothetical protein
MKHSALMFLPLLTLGFAACISLIRAQPYDNSQLRAILTPPDGCPMPCFLGIRPGVTTCTQAVAILETHAWVGEVRADDCPEEGTASGRISWSWNGQRPPLLKTETNQRNEIRLEAGIVQNMLVYTSIPIADVWMLYGTPDHGIVDVVTVPSEGGYRARIVNSSGYLELGLDSLSYPPCPAALISFWAAPTRLFFSHQPQTREMSMSRFLYLLVYHNQLCRG